MSVDAACVTVGIETSTFDEKRFLGCILSEFVISKCLLRIIMVNCILIEGLPVETISRYGDC